MRVVVLASLLPLTTVLAQDEHPERTPDPAKVARTRPRSPADAIAAIELPPGYRLELVASEPMIREPAALAWDGNGRMYVAELRTYMQDIDGTDELAPTSRVSRLDDSDGDGRMDTATVFIDGLVLPRMLLPLQDGLIVRETGTLDLHLYRDTDGDGVADDKQLVYAGGKRGGNLEHQPSGLDWNVDNYLYVTYTNKRYRFSDGRIEAHPLPAGDGQWGMTHDDWGQCFYSRAGGEVVASNFQQNLQYGKLALPDQLEPGFEECWPLDDVPDVQGGLPRVRADGSLNHFTGCCGQSVFRGDRLPAELRGNLFVPEPVGRLVRRATVHVVDGTRVLRHPHGRSEFLRTADANFRPVNSYTAPDGTLYLVDMYRGIIQEGNWVRKGSYLRGVVQEYGLDRNIGRGRIYRLVHEDHEPGPRPRMLDESSAELVAHLAHPNGWWRDNAQKLLVVRGDRSVVRALRRMMGTHRDPLARLHAMWTLHGLDAWTEQDALRCLADRDPRQRAAAIRASERFLGERPADAVLAAVVALADDDDVQVVLQVVRTALYTTLPGYEALVRRVVDAHPDNRAIAGTASSWFERVAREQAAARERAAIAKENAALAAAIERGAGIYQTLCFTCHGSDGKGAPVVGVPELKQAPTLIGSPRVLGSHQRLGRIVLNGLQGPIDGETYIAAMASMSMNDDAWIADVLTFVRNSWGNQAPRITAEQIAAVRAACAHRTEPWTLAELKPFDPVLAGRARWQLTADRNAADLHHCVDGDPATRWTTRQTQRPGQWLVIELPEAVEIAEIALATEASPGDFPQRYEVRTSRDGETWSEPIASGEGSRDDPRIHFQPVTTRWLKITQLGSKPNLWWSIHELDLYGPRADADGEK
ncbi:MAG: discoidin domain-containing protein [Planctomycetes bacterium]|nr:discoidin domain-containing protein [Planctomycetota bacterium]